MSTFHRPTALTLSIATALPCLATPLSAWSQSAESLEPIVVTAPNMQTPLVTRVDPRAPQQPLPTNDGASLLKSIPGMSVIRKGGTDGDPVFRGMAASRLNILIDGEHIMGGCGMRMDPPTAYVFPDSFDELTLIKGPQTVQYGPGNSAGTVLFERQPTRYTEPGYSVRGALTAASYGRLDGHLDARAGTEKGYVQAIATDARSEDYRDGHGDLVHSAYQRSSLTAVAGWTPDEDTRFEVSAIQSRGRAAYGDRSMDGSQFSRDNVGFKLNKARLSPIVRRLETQVYYNYVDHVMDNYSLRTPPASASSRMASNPDRKTTGGRMAVTLTPDDTHQIVVGLDEQDNIHTVRNSGMGGELVTSYLSRPRLEDARFANLGLFAEVTHHIDDNRRLVLGARQDRWDAQDKRTSITSGMMNLGSNPTTGRSRDLVLPGGFIRYEHDWGAATQAYIGIGHVERAPDYWELISKESTNSISAFSTLAPEKTTQLDAGLTHEAGRIQAFASAYYSHVQDYVLIQSNYAKAAGMGSRTTTVARNVNARTAGLEAGMHYALTPQWMSLASVAYAYGQNETDGHALGQM
ncbi:MAG TPA: TonB-dependent copper receptor, partial [Aquabacterium sp.]|nr:TonB-dependent copper receptor [Aquabacterium sp.]